METDQKLFQPVYVNRNRLGLPTSGGFPGAAAPPGLVVVATVVLSSTTVVVAPGSDAGGFDGDGGSGVCGLLGDGGFWADMLATCAVRLVRLADRLATCPCNSS